MERLTDVSSHYDGYGLSLEHGRRGRRERHQDCLRPHRRQVRRHLEGRFQRPVTVAGRCRPVCRPAGAV
jgi:hypothetical protein